MKKLLTLILLLFAFTVCADTATVTFEPPTEREDGSALPANEIAGFEVLDINSVVLQVLAANATGFTETLTAGSYARFLLTVDTDGRKSQLSPQFLLEIPHVPKPPVVLNISISP